MIATTANVIEIDDTVRLAGRTGKGVVTCVTDTHIEITYTFGIRRGGREYRTSTANYPRARVELVRKGNALNDKVTAFLDEVDGPRAAAAGMTLADYRTAEAARLVAEADAATARRADTARAIATARAEADAARAAEAARVAAARDEADAAELAQIEAARVAGAAHLAAHGGDYLAYLLCGVGGGACDLA